MVVILEAVGHLVGVGSRPIVVVQSCGQRRDSSKAPAARWLVDDEGDEEKVLHPTDNSEPETEGRESSSSSESSDDDST